MIVGLVGTGMLGEAVGMRLLEKGIGVVAYNRTQDKTKRLAAGGADIAESPADAARRCEMLITCVRDADAVSQISFGRDGIVGGQNAGLVVCDMSTINPLSSRKIAARFADAGITMLDTPVMGGPDAAARGGLIMMASGDRECFDRCRPVLDAIAEKVFYLGKGGTAHSVKLAMNLQIAALAISLSEGITLARGASVDPEVFLEILNSTYFGTGMSRKKAYRMIKGEYEPTFLLKNLRKDLHIINEAASSFGIRLPMGALAEEIYGRAEESGFGGLDYTGILAYLESTGKKPDPAR